MMLDDRTNAADEVALTPAPGAPVELEIGLDIAKRGLLVGPALIALCGVIWGMNGVYSAAVAVGLIIVNFVVSALLVSTAAKISVGMLMGAVLFGYVARLGLILVAILLVRDASWISLPALGAAIIVTHLGLLLWELRYVAISMAHPGLKPDRPSR